MDKIKMRDFLLLILTILVFTFAIFLEVDIKDLQKENKKIKTKLELLSEEQATTQAVLNAHLTNQLSKDWGGEE